AEGFDDVIGGDAQMRGAFLEHLQHRAEHAIDGGMGLVLALVEAPLAVEMAEEFIGAVEQVDDHGSLISIPEALASARIDLRPTRAGSPVPCSGRPDRPQARPRAVRPPLSARTS